MLEKKNYLDFIKKSAERILGKVEDATRKALDKTKALLETPATIGKESNSLYEGMIFFMPPVELVESAECFALQEYAGNEYVALLVEHQGKVTPIAKGRLAREPRLVDETDDYKLKRDGSKFVTMPLPGTFFEVYRKGKTFKEAILLVAKVCAENNARVKVGKPIAVLTSAYNGKTGKDGTTEVLIYPMDIVAANGNKVSRTKLGLS